MKPISILPLALFAAVCQADPVPGAVRAMAHHTRAFHLIDATASGSLRWAAWGTHKRPRQAVHLALFSVSEGHSRLRWATTLADAYEPEIRTLSSWRYRGQAIMAATYSYGAAARQITLYGLQDRTPVALGEALGEEIGWTIDSENRLVLKVYQSEGARLTAACQRWDEAAGKLEDTRCE